MPEANPEHRLDPVDEWLDTLSDRLPGEWPNALLQEAARYAAGDRLPAVVVLAAKAMAERLPPYGRCQAAAEALGAAQAADVDRDPFAAAIMFAVHRALRRAQIAAAARPYQLHLAGPGYDPVPEILRVLEPDLPMLRRSAPTGLARRPGGKPCAVAIEPLVWSPCEALRKDRAAPAAAAGCAELDLQAALDDAVRKAPAPYGHGWAARLPDPGEWPSCFAPPRSAIILVLPANA